MRQISYPAISKLIYPKIVKSFPDKKGELFFTFDDGPTPNVTTLVLDILNEYKAKATFFCLGENIEMHHSVYEQILRAGHTTGNHGYKHLDGWKISRDEFKENTEKGRKISNSCLFRPPYGHLKPSQYKWAIQDNEIIAWDIMTYDFDKKLHWKKSLQIATQKPKNGSILVFHDNEKTNDKLIKILPLALETLQKKSFTFHELFRS